MTRLAVLALGVVIGVLAERYRQDWQASAWAYHHREDRITQRVPRRP